MPHTLTLCAHLSLHKRAAHALMQKKSIKPFGHTSACVCAQTHTLHIISHRNLSVAQRWAGWPKDGDAGTGQHVACAEPVRQLCQQKGGGQPGQCTWKSLWPSFSDIGWACTPAPPSPPTLQLRPPPHWPGSWQQAALRSPLTRPCPFPPPHPQPCSGQGPGSSTPCAGSGGHSENMSPCSHGAHHVDRESDSEHVSGHGETGERREWGRDRYL